MNKVAIIGAGRAGKALLSILLQIPGLSVKYMCDIDPEAPGLILAWRNKIEVLTDENWTPVLDDRDVDMIFEVTGSDNVFKYLQEHKHPGCNIMNASMSRVIFFLLNAQQDVARELREYKLKLAERVIERTDELEKVNYQLKEQIDIEQRLNEKLQQINNEKTKYLLNATHQLKAPFAAIQSYADILLEGYSDHIGERSLAIIGKIKDRCILLSGLIRKMLELANLNSAIIENIPMKKENLIDIISLILENETGILEKRNITVDFSHSGEKEEILCNRDQIATLIEILLENAVNYSHDGSRIIINLEKDKANRLIFSISDEGIGIEEKNLSKIFNEYFRSYKAVETYENGTGLGLSIARRIAKLHNTDIMVDSTPEKGSTFIIPFRTT